MKDDNKKSERRRKLAPNGPPFVPPEIIPDNLQVPDKTILLVPDTQDFVNPPHFIKAGQHRDWFDSYFYHCLPLVFGNQHGFLMLATHDFVCRWNGKDDFDAVSVHFLEPVLEPNYLTIESHFGFGILTIQSRYIFRTPPGVNLMVKEPPNYPIHGFSWMNAVVETDSLRRDFTFNIKITQPHLDIYIPRNTPLGCLLPYPRYFLDDYNMAELKEAQELRKSERTVSYFAKERLEFDSSPRHRYMEGIDIYNIEFKHHQKTLDHGKWWFSKKGEPLPKSYAGEMPVQNNWLLASVANKLKNFFGGKPSPPAAETKTTSLSKSENQISAVEHPGSSIETAKCPVKHSHESTVEPNRDSVETAKCPVKHGQESAIISSAKEAAKTGLALKPENYPEIMELNAELPESTITLYLPPDYDRSLAPIKADKHRVWFEQDTKTKDHARFCLPLTMGAGIGWFILSPATFKVTWDGDPTHNAEVEILDPSSHAEIDNHSAFGSFTIQTRFIPRTKNPGDFVFIKGIANQYRLPYYFLEAMVEAWWSPANFGLVAMLNQAGEFTIQKGEPVAQMFAINVDQASYAIALKDGYPSQWQEWDIKRRDSSYTGKNFDYLKGRWPDETQVYPHFKGWSLTGASIDGTTAAPKVIEPKPTKDRSSLTANELAQSARMALGAGNYSEAAQLLNLAVEKSTAETNISVDLISIMHAVGRAFEDKSEFENTIAILSKALEISQHVDNVGANRLISILTDLAFAERQSSNLPVAEEHYRAALQLAIEKSEDEIMIARNTFYIGSLLDQRGKYEESEPLISRALDIQERKLGEKHPETLFTRNGLACLYTHMQKFAEAEELFNSVLADRAEVLGKDSLDLADSYNDLGFLYRDINNLPKAAEAFKRAAEIRARKLGKDDLGSAEFLTNLAFVYRTNKDFIHAKECFEKVLAIKEKHYPAKHRSIAECLENLAHTYVDLGQEDEAAKLFKKAKAMI